MGKGTSDCDSKLALTDDQFLGAIEKLVELMVSLENEYQEFVELASKAPEKISSLFSPSIPGGWFYEHTYFEHLNIFVQLAGLSEAVSELMESGDLFGADFNSMWVDPPAWLSTGEENEKKSIFMAALYTLQRSTNAIKITAKPINLLIEEGRNGDRSALKLAIKLDPLAITSPTVAAEILKSDLTDGGDFRTHVKSALRYPFKAKKVNHGMLRFVLKTMHDDGRLERLSEKDRYEFFCQRLSLYPGESFEAPESLNRFIRQCVRSFRT